jgi:hypothetical protein
MESCQSAETPIERLFLARSPWDIIGMLEGRLQKNRFPGGLNLSLFCLTGLKLIPIQYLKSAKPYWVKWNN